MAFAISDYLVTDDLTILLALIAATVFLLNNLYKPQPLVHPILLGRQSDVGRARNPSESAVYRNYGTGLMGRFPLRPAKEVQVISDFVKPESEASRTLWSSKITSNQLQDRVAAVATGLIRLANLRSQESRVLLLLNDSLEFIIADLALASHSIVSQTLSSSTLLSSVLEQHPPSAIITHAFLLPQILELIYDQAQTSNHTIIVVGEPSAQAMASVASRVKVLQFLDVEREGMKVPKAINSVPIKSSDVFTVSFYQTESGQLQGAEFTHENLTAGVAATRALLPLNHALSPLDTIVSAHSLSTAYGRAIAYTAIWEGTSFATVRSSDLYQPEERNVNRDSADIISAKRFPIPSPTILFIKSEHLDSIVGDITINASKSWLLYPIAWRHKLASLTEGFLTRESLWDRLVFDSARAKIIGDSSATLRGVVVSGGPIDASKMTPARIALSVPLVNCYHHALAAGPVLASHPLDLQDFSQHSGAVVAHVGPPSVNIETKLVDVEDERVERGADPVGILHVRGPSVGQLIGAVALSDEELKEGWVKTEARATVQTNGSFQVLSPF